MSDSFKTRIWKNVVSLQVINEVSYVLSLGISQTVHGELSNFTCEPCTIWVSDPVSQSYTMQVTLFFIASHLHFPCKEVSCKNMSLVLVYPEISSQIRDVNVEKINLIFSFSMNAA